MKSQQRSSSLNGWFWSSRSANHPLAYASPLPERVPLEVKRAAAERFVGRSSLRAATQKTLLQRHSAL